ncbi:glycosyltransferase family 2 protein [Polaribacter atrinae]|uniref:glycosyltransferase family 2 protein n=1 Tax=Polaribacter atrinae TaxID=1333662 RepID=UPI0030FAD0DF
MEYLVSIITINYNNLVGLEKTVTSVVNQTYSNFEYLIIDGGSIDESFEYLSSKKDFFTYFVSEKDSGIYNAMNKGIKASKGEYLLFLNSGDVLIGETALNDFINNSSFSGDIIYGDYQFLDGRVKKYPDVITPLHFLKSSLPHQSSLIKRDLFFKLGLYDERFEIVSDKAFFLKCLLSNQVEFKHISQALSVIDLNGVSNNKECINKVILENSIILKENLGVYYADYKAMLELQRENKNIKKQTIRGLFVRIKNKFKSFFL